MVHNISVFAWEDVPKISLLLEISQQKWYSVSLTKTLRRPLYLKMSSNAINFFFLACLLYFSNTRRRDLKQFYAWIKIYKVSDCKIIITFCSLLILVYCPLRKTLQIFIKKTLYNFLCECYCCNENLKFKKIWNVEDTYKSIYQYFCYRFFLLSSLL